MSLQPEAVLRAVELQDPRLRRRTAPLELDLGADDHFCVRAPRPVASRPFSARALWTGAAFHLLLPLGFAAALLTRPRTAWPAGHRRRLLLETAMYALALGAALLQPAGVATAQVVGPLCSLLLLVAVYAALRGAAGSEAPQAPLSAELALLSRRAARDRTQRRAAVASAVDAASQGALRGLRAFGHTTPGKRRTLEDHHLGFVSPAGPPPDSPARRRVATTDAAEPPAVANDLPPGEHVFRAEDLACEVLGIARGVKRWRSFHWATRLLSVAYALLGIGYAVANGDARDWDARDAAAVAASAVAGAWYALLLLQVLHQALFAFLARAHVARYLGALLSRDLAPDYRLPYLALDHAATSVVNVVTWASMRDVLLRRVMGADARRTTVVLGFFLAADVALCLAALWELLVADAASQSVELFHLEALFVTVVLSAYVLRILRNGARANEEQAAHHTALAAALFALRVQRDSSASLQRRARDAADVVAAVAAYLQSADERCTVFSVEVDASLIGKLLVFLLASLGAQALEILVLS